MLWKVGTKDRMMKKISLLLAALLVLTPVYAASAGATFKTYHNEANGYAIDYPSDWTILSKETLETTMDSIASGETPIKGMDASTLETYKAQIEAMDMVIFMSADGVVNANINCQTVPVQLTGDLIIKSVYPAVVQQLQTAFADYGQLAEPQIEKVGDYEFVETAGQHTLSGMNFIMLQAYYCSESTLYTITYTINASMNPDMEALESIFSAMVASFTPA